MYNNKLEYSTVYLAGPIDYAKDHGVKWRTEITEDLSKMGILVLDPTNKPGGLISETTTEQSKINKYKKEKDWNSLCKFMKDIRRTDLRLVDMSDFIIALIDTDIHMCGTYDEIFTAEDQQKPVLFIVPNGIESLSSWMYSVINPAEVFNSVDECINYIKNIDNETVTIDRRWVLVKKELMKMAMENNNA